MMLLLPTNTSRLTDRPQTYFLNDGPFIIKNDLTLPNDQHQPDHETTDLWRYYLCQVFSAEEKFCIIHNSIIITGYVDTGFDGHYTWIQYFIVGAGTVVDPTGTARHQTTAGSRESMVEFSITVISGKPTTCHGRLCIVRTRWKRAPRRERPRGTRQLRRVGRHGTYGNHCF